MKYGMIRVGSVSPDLKVADCKYNVDKIIENIEKAKKLNIQILSFPELCITSYTCGDLFHQSLLLNSSEKELSRLLQYLSDINMVVIAGMPVRADNKLFNCGIVIYKGNILGVVPKTYIPNNSEFYEERWFTSSVNSISDNVNLCGQNVPFGTNLLFQDENTSELCIALEICEDLWVPIPPSSLHCLHGATIIINPSASNEVVAKNEYRKSLVNIQSAKCIAAYIYTSAGQSESTTDVVFSGHCIIAENGVVLKESEKFSDESQIIYTEVDFEKLSNDRRKTTSFMESIGSSEFLKKAYRKIYFSLQQSNDFSMSRYVDAVPFVPKDINSRNKRCKEIFDIQVAGLSKRMKHAGFKTAVVGISGGLDSTLALLVCAKTFDRLKIDRKNILGVTMPGFGTTGRTYQNALDLIKALNASLLEISIKDACMQHFQDIGHDPSIHDVTYENTQARERTQILMDLSNKYGGLVIGTGDLSELALGWSTYNGDHMSMYGVNCGVPKTLVRYLVKWVSDNIISEKAKATLIDILDTPVSPELLPADKNGKINQKTESIVGPYELHDFFLYNMIRFGFSPSKIAYLAEYAFNSQYDTAEILKWLKLYYRRFFTQQFKRSCLPDGPKVGSICLSPRGDWRMPSDASYHIWMDEIDKLINDCNK